MSVRYALIPLRRRHSRVNARDPGRPSARPRFPRAGIGPPNRVLPVGIAGFLVRQLPFGHARQQPRITTIKGGKNASGNWPHLGWISGRHFTRLIRKKGLVLTGISEYPASAIRVFGDTG
jgi:hypothetical protein